MFYRDIELFYFNHPSPFIVTLSFSGARHSTGENEEEHDKEGERIHMTMRKREYT
jgi:hypothetical protein